MLDRSLLGKCICWEMSDGTSTVGGNRLISAGRVIGFIRAGKRPKDELALDGVRFGRVGFRFYNNPTTKDRYVVAPLPRDAEEDPRATTIQSDLVFFLIEEDGRPVLKEPTPCPRCESEFTGAAPGEPDLMECYVCGHKFKKEESA